MQAGQIFFSYSRADASFALKLGEDLRKAGIDIWIDQIDIKPSEPWDEEIEKALQESQCLLVILSKTSVASDNVLNEINYALESKKQVLPILLEKDIKKPLNIIRLQHIDFTGSYEIGCSLLLNSLRSGKPINPVNKRSPRLIIPITIIAAIIIITAGVLLKIKINEPGNDDGPALIKDKRSQVTDSIKTSSANPNGIWITEEITNPFDQFDKYTIDFTLEAFDSVLIGNMFFKSTVDYKGYKIKKGFLGGQIKNNNISFYTVERFAGEENQPYKDFYKGTIINDTIKFSIESDRPLGFPGQQFVARRSTAVIPGK